MVVVPIDKVVQLTTRLDLCSPGTRAEETINTRESLSQPSFEAGPPQL
jgi:hypothetical protein